MMAGVRPGCVFADFTFAAWAGSPWVITILVVSAFFLLAWLFPYHFFRCLLWVIGRTLYRVRTIGREHVPRTGGALLVCNHVSCIHPLPLPAAHRPSLPLFPVPRVTPASGIPPLPPVAHALP